MTVEELLAERGRSYDLSAKLRTWHDAKVAPRRRFSDLARRYPLDESIIVDWSLPRGRRRHRDVPARRIPRLAELLGTTVEALMDAPELAPELRRAEPVAPAPTQTDPVSPTGCRSATTAYSRAVSGPPSIVTYATYAAIHMGPSWRCARGHYACVRTHAPQPHATVTRGPA